MRGDFPRVWWRFFWSPLFVSVSFHLPSTPVIVLWSRPSSLRLNSLNSPVLRKLNFSPHTLCLVLSQLLDLQNSLSSTFRWLNSKDGVDTIISAFNALFFSLKLYFINYLFKIHHIESQCGASLYVICLRRSANFCYYRFRNFRFFCFVLAWT